MNNTLSGAFISLFESKKQKQQREYKQEYDQDVNQINNASKIYQLTVLLQNQKVSSLESLKVIFNKLDEIKDLYIDQTIDINVNDLKLICVIKQGNIHSLKLIENKLN